jgi:hypothetical protein
MADEGVLTQMLNLAELLLIRAKGEIAECDTQLEAHRATARHMEAQVEQLRAKLKCAGDGCAGEHAGGEKVSED